MAVAPAKAAAARNTLRPFGGGHLPKGDIACMGRRGRAGAFPSRFLVSHALPRGRFARCRPASPPLRVINERSGPFSAKRGDDENPMLTETQ